MDVVNEGDMVGRVPVQAVPELSLFNCIFCIFCILFDVVGGVPVQTAPWLRFQIALNNKIFSLKLLTTGISSFKK